MREEVGGEEAGQGMTVNTGCFRGRGKLSKNRLYDHEAEGASGWSNPRDPCRSWVAEGTSTIPRVSPPPPEDLASSLPSLPLAAVLGHQRNPTARVVRSHPRFNPPLVTAHLPAAHDDDVKVREPIIGLVAPGVATGGLGEGGWGRGGGEMRGVQGGVGCGGRAHVLL